MTKKKKKGSLSRLSYIKHYMWCWTVNRCSYIKHPIMSGLLKLSTIKGVAIYFCFHTHIHTPTHIQYVLVIHSDINGEFNCLGEVDKQKRLLCITDEFIKRVLPQAPRTSDFQQFSGTIWSILQRNPP